MSQLYDMREAIRDAIVEADIGWTAATIIIERQGSFWNQVASSIASAKNRAVLHLGVSSGKPTESESLEMEITLPITIICTPQTDKEAKPEEDLWEDLVKFLHGFLPEDSEFYDRLIFAGFTDIDIQADGGTAYLGRQTIFTRQFSLT